MIWDIDPKNNQICYIGNFYLDRHHHMKIEIITSTADNPVAEFFSSSSTPETDGKASPHIGFFSCATVPAEFARKLERERDETREAFKIAYNERVKAELERDEVRAELADWQDSALNVRKEFDDEHHCSCVPILRKLLKDAERERDKAIEKHRLAVIHWQIGVFKMQRERDEAREAFVIATDQMVIAQGKVREANKERDEAIDLAMKTIKRLEANKP
jgi:hypothetical protein